MVSVNSLWGPYGATAFGPAALIVPRVRRPWFEFNSNENAMLTETHHGHRPGEGRGGCVSYHRVSAATLTSIKHSLQRMPRPISRPVFARLA